jgi:hypothetical protein
MEEYRIELIRTSPKTQDLIYYEGSRRLVVYLELAGFGKTDWVGADEDLSRWSAPAGVLVPADKKAEILSRIADWSKQNRIRLDIGPGLTRDEFLARQQADGWTLQTIADGSVLATPPHVGLWLRTKRLFHALFGPSAV